VILENLWLLSAEGHASKKQHKKRNLDDAQIEHDRSVTIY